MERSYLMRKRDSWTTSTGFRSRVYSARLERKYNESSFEVEANSFALEFFSGEKLFHDFFPSHFGVPDSLSIPVLDSVEECQKALRSSAGV